MYSRFLKTSNIALFVGCLTRSFQIVLMTALFVFCCSACSSRSKLPATLATTPSSSIATDQFVKPAGVLRVCADPNNLPFSNDRREGFENKIADVLARALGERVEYTWWAQRRGFFRNTLKSGACDLVIGVPSGFEMALTTTPYYRSTYVFVYRKDRHLELNSFDDPRLHNLKIGVQIIGDDFSNTPPAHALSNRNIIANVHGFTLYGNYQQSNPPARVIEAVENRDVDLAIVWGPLAGYFAKHSRTSLEVVPVTPQIDQPFMPFVFDISMGVRRGDQNLRDQVERIVEQRRSEIDRILADYGVPRVDNGRGGNKGV